MHSPVEIVVTQYSMKLTRTTVGSLCGKECIIKVGSFVSSAHKFTVICLPTQASFQASFNDVSSKFECSQSCLNSCLSCDELGSIR